MQFFVGTSGYGYKEWKGIFYPERFPAAKMLNFYSERFNSVELNGTFRKMPTADSLGKLVEQVPKTFRFVTKANQTITHFKRLNEVDEIVQELVQATQALKKQRGPVLFQLPPNFKKDLDRLRSFLQSLDKRQIKAAFEFRHASWYDDEVYSLLKKHSCALCAVDDVDTPPVQVVITAEWGYARLRRLTYTRKQLAGWFEKLAAQDWKETYVYFKHEENAKGAKLAASFLKLFNQ